MKLKKRYCLLCLKTSSNFIDTHMQRFLCICSCVDSVLVLLPRTGDTDPSANPGTTAIPACDQYSWK